MKIFKKVLAIFFALLIMNMVIISSACSENHESSSSLPSAPEGSFVVKDGTYGLVSGDYELLFPKTEGKFGVSVALKDNTATIYSNSEPANVKVRGKGSGIGIETFEEKSYKNAYTNINKTSYGYSLTANVKTDAGSSFSVVDSYFISAEGLFGVKRDVVVETAVFADKGFASIYSLENSGGVTDSSKFDYFIPSILYKDTSNMPAVAIGSSLNGNELLVKETRTGMPMVMAYNKTDKTGIALAHLEPKISVNGILGGGSSGDINDGLQYGSIGLTMNSAPVGVEFVYPCTEGPTTYDAGATFSRKYHDVNQGNSHSYKVAIAPTNAQTYTDAMTDTYLKVYEGQKVDQYKVNIDIENVYEENIKLFKSNYLEYSYDGSVVAAGLPFSVQLPDGDPSDTVSFQMGFVGQQIPAGYELLRYGYENDNLLAVKQGMRIVDFWSADKIQGSYFPIVWWSPANNANGGRVQTYPCFLRVMVDGMEGMLDAYRISAAYGVNKVSWKNAVVKFGEHLVAQQNSDGSFYRAYNLDGSVCTDTSDSRYQGTSKLNTPIAVRFLAKMYEFTGEQKYKTAAIKAADYAYNELYVNLGKYVGGTPDNANVVDKEAAVYAMYCFNNAYMLTNDSKYLAAAKHAAVSSMSWTYAYDFACPNQSKDDNINPFKNGGVMGFSIIAVGHSGADNFSAYTYYEIYKTYLLSGDARFKSMAEFMQNATKLCGDYDGRVGYEHAAYCPEATNVSDFTFASVGTWLTWSGVANIEPISNFEETFGVKDIAKLNIDLESQRAALNAYGCGGKTIYK